MYKSEPRITRPVIMMRPNIMYKFISRAYIKVKDSQEFDARLFFAQSFADIHPSFDRLIPLFHTRCTSSNLCQQLHSKPQCILYIYWHFNNVPYMVILIMLISANSVLYRKLKVHLLQNIEWNENIPPVKSSMNFGVVVRSGMLSQRMWF